MGKTIQVAADRAHDDTKTVLPAEVARGIYIRNPPGLRARKLMHLMIATAGGRMGEDVEHRIRLSDIRRIEGMAHHDRKSLEPLFEELRATVLTHDDPQAMKVSIGGFLDTAEVDYSGEAAGDLLLSWYFSRMFTRMAGASDLWVILDRQTIFALTSKYSVLLFQHIASLTNLSHVSSQTFTVAELRALLGVEKGKMVRFADLNRRAIQPALAEISQLSRFTLTATPKKIGRTVARVEIAWAVKPDLSAAKAEVTRHSAGRQARRDGTVERPVAVFPETGGIIYSPHWQDLKRAAGCNLDDMLVGTRFRAFLADRGIRRDASNIEQMFSDWCRKVGKV